MSNWSENLPDTNTWAPRSDASDRLATLFAKRCADAEARILREVEAEKAANIDNFDHGPAVEDLFRKELKALLPSRYSVQPGVVDDRYGNTAGDCDAVLLNEEWFPFIKTGATDQSRRRHFPIEGAYAVLEFKSVLTDGVLDEAMKKLVCCHRLHRPTISGTRITENRSLPKGTQETVNPLYSCIFATGLPANINIEIAADRFFRINKTLPRKDVVRSLCVLGHGTVSWGKPDDSKKAGTSVVPFFSDHDIPIYPVITKAQSVGSALYISVVEMMTCLHNVILSADNCD